MQSLIFFVVEFLNKTCFTERNTDLDGFEVCCHEDQIQGKLVFEKSGWVS